LHFEKDEYSRQGYDGVFGDCNRSDGCNLVSWFYPTVNSNRKLDDCVLITSCSFQHTSFGGRKIWKIVTSRPLHEHNLGQPESSNLEDVQISADDDIEVTLAEIRASGHTTLPVAVSTQARNEYVVNVLITKTVIVEDVAVPVNKDHWILKPNSNSNSSMSCAICLLDYQIDDKICWSHNRRCNHHFHAPCIQQWLWQGRDDCPCCRHDYLALSSDDEEEEEGSTEEESARTSSQENNNVPWSNQSYFSTFTRMSTTEFESYTRGLEQGVRLAALADIESGQGLDLDDDEENTILGSIGLQSSSNSTSTSVYTETLEEREDAWSCPGESDIDDNAPISEDRHLRPRRRRQRSWGRDWTRQGRAAGHPWIIDMEQPPRSAVLPESDVNLGLGELIVEGLMQRLEDRTDHASVDTESSGSVYTHVEKAEEEDIPSQGNKNQSVRHQDRDSNCAICRKEYQVSQEICWSRDPLCNHVFHRVCMEEWIVDNNECPLCAALDDDIFAGDVEGVKDDAEYPFGQDPTRCGSDFNNTLEEGATNQDIISRDFGAPEVQAATNNESTNLECSSLEQTECSSLPTLWDEEDAGVVFRDIESFSSKDHDSSSGKEGDSKDDRGDACVLGIMKASSQAISVKK
jgi:hypothetical protein